MEFVPTSTVWKDGHRIQPICTVRFQVSASPTTRESMSGGAQVCSTYDAPYAPIETVQQMFNDALLRDDGAACVAHLTLSGCFQAVRLGDLGPLPESIAHYYSDYRLPLDCVISTSTTGIYFHVFFIDGVDMVDARTGNVMMFNIKRTFNSHFMLPKRRFWKDEQKMKCGFSMEFSTIRSPNRVLTPLKSVSNIRISSFVHPSKIFV